MMVRLFVILSLSLLALSSARAAPPPGSTGQYHDWFDRQLVPDGSGKSCCKEGDGHILSDDDWRIREGEYEVLISGEWVRFPNTGDGHLGNKVLGYTGNPTGHPVAWYASASVIYCLAPGTVS